jgi:parvulin-like peptidyl-prolyl isomerase
VSRSLRVASLAVAALAALPVLSACHTNPGSAALVGGHRITTGELQSEVNGALADPAVTAALANPQYSKPLGANRTGFIRATLGRLINQQVVDEVAAAHHVTVTPQEIKAQIASFVQQAGSLTALQTSAADQVGVSVNQLPSLIRFTVMQQKLSTALIANLTATPAQLAAEYQKDIDTYDQIDIAQIAVATKALGETVLAKAKADPSSFGALAEKYSVDTASKANGGEVGYVGRSQVQQVLGAADKNAGPGSIVLAHTSGDYVVIHIIARRTEPISAVTGKLKTAIFQSQSQTLLEKAIVAEAKKLGVSVSPRYGHWDNATQSVVATKSPVSAG